MSGYLLDTHVILWWLDDPSKLSEEAQQAIRAADNLVYVSSAAVWEMAIKKSLGRLGMPANLPDALQDDHIQVLDVNIHHALAVADLPLLHQDPFDRMQIAQANLQNLTLITGDRRIQQYDVQWLKA